MGNWMHKEKQLSDTIKISFQGHKFWTAYLQEVSMLILTEKIDQIPSLGL